MLEWVVSCPKGVHRQAEWDRLVRAARARKMLHVLPTCEEEKKEWAELDRRDSELHNVKRKRTDRC